MPRLDVRVCAARGLPDTQTFGKIDPYITVELEGKRFKSEVRDNTQNPTWEEVFKYNVADDNSAQITFSLWNKNLMSDDFLGSYTMSVSGLTRGVEEEKWVLLQQCKSNAELQVKLLAHDFGQLPAEGAVPPAPAPGAPPQQYQAPPSQPGYAAPPSQPGYPAPPQPGYAAPPSQPGYPAPPQPGYAQPPMPGMPMNGMVYELVPRHSPGMLVDVMGGNPAPGTALHLWAPLGVPNQRFRCVDRGMGYFSLLPTHAEHLAVQMNVQNGAQFTIQPQNPADPSQSWRAQPTDSGFFQVLCRACESKGFDCAGAGAGQGTHITTWDMLPGAQQQQFMFRQV